MAPEDSPCYEVKGLKRFAGLNSPTIFLPMPSSVQIQVRSKLLLVSRAPNVYKFFVLKVVNYQCARI